MEVILCFDKAGVIHLCHSQAFNKWFLPPWPILYFFNTPWLLFLSTPIFWLLILWFLPMVLGFLAQVLVVPQPWGCEYSLLNNYHPFRGEKILNPIPQGENQNFDSHNC